MDGRGSLNFKIKGILLREVRTAATGMLTMLEMLHLRGQSGIRAASSEVLKAKEQIRDDPYPSIRSTFMISIYYYLFSTILF